MKKRILIEVISALFIFLFAYTSLSKLNGIPQFQAVLKQSPLLGSRSHFFSLSIPIAELIVSILLFLPTTRMWGLYGAFALMLLFTLYIAYMINFTPHLPCSCGGVLKEMTWPQHLIFNIVLFILSTIALILYKKRSVKVNL